MLSPGRIARRIRNLFTARQRDAELEEELRFHLDLEAERHQRRGVDDETASLLARRTFGDITRVREDAHDSRGVRSVEDFLQDLRIGFRSLGRQRVHATVAVLTLSIGIGSTTAIFGAVYGAIFAPLPYANSDRIVTLWQTERATGSGRDDVAPGNFLDWRERSKSFALIAAAEPFSLDYIGREGPERFQNAIVTEGFFEILGTKPMLGRTFTPEEFAPERNHVVVLSEKLWRAHFGADSSIIGRTLILDSIPMQVVGVMPRGIDLPRGEQLWTPKVFRPDERESRTSAYYTVIALLRPGVTIDAAQAEMRAVAAVLAAEHPTTNAKTGVSVLRLDEVLTGDARQSLLLLLGAVLFVLLISCANVASLQLAQAVRRRRELAIRAALGAGRGRLMRQLLTESVLLAAIGGTLGIGLAWVGLTAIRALAPANLPRIENVQLDVTMMIFALVISALTAILFGTLPMLEASRTQIGEVIGTSGGRSATSPRARRRVQRSIVGAEVAAATVLLVGAGLLLRSFASLIHVDRGFSTDHVTSVTVQAWGYYPTAEARIAFVREAERRVAAIPGVEAVGMTSSLPLSAPIGMERTSMQIEDQPDAVAADPPVIHVAAATEGYFGVLRIPLRAGRMLDASDNASAAPVMLVNEAFVRRYWKGANAIGKRVTFRFQGPPVARTVVGVVGNVRHEGLASDPAPAVFIPHAQGPTGAVQLVVRSHNVDATQRAIRATLAKLNGAMPLTDITSLDARLADSLRERRFHLSLLLVFSVTALLLAAVGIYGLMSNLTTERTREIGVRVAVGARAADVVWMMVRQGFVVAVIGTTLGIAAAVALTRLMAGMLYGITPLDPTTYVMSLMLLLGVATMATWLPARRAAGVDPMNVLRTE